jgi:hypothetical protein
MKLSEIRGWDLDYTLEQVTTDEILLWQEFWFQELDTPYRLTYYLMGLMAEVRRPNVKHPASIKIEDMRIKFQDRRHKPRSVMTDQQRIEHAKAKWFMGLGGPPGSDTKHLKPSIMQKKIRPNQT